MKLEAMRGQKPGRQPLSRKRKPNLNKSSGGWSLQSGRVRRGGTSRKSKLIPAIAFYSLFLLIDLYPPRIQLRYLVFVSSGEFVYRFAMAFQHR